MVQDTGCGIQNRRSALTSLYPASRILFSKYAVHKIVRFTIYFFGNETVYVSLEAG